MKKRIAWSVVGIILLAVALVSCGNMLAHTGGGSGEGGGAGNSGGGTRTGAKTLSLVVENYGEHFGNGPSNSVAGGSLRTIVGDPYDSTQVTFYLWGESSTGTALQPKQVNVTPAPDNKSGTVTVDLNPGSWDLTLAAVPTVNVGQIVDPNVSSNILDKATLAGEAHVDTMNASTVRFTLRSDGLGAPSAVTVNVQADTAWFDNARWTAHAGIYDILTGNLVANATKDDISVQLTGGQTASYSKTNIAPGKYLFKVSFATVASPDVVIATWSDTIIIYAAKDLTSTVVIPNIIGVKPANPTDFQTGWEKAKAEVVPNLYQVTFNWVRGNTKNETGFELELMDIGDEAVPTAGTPDQIQLKWEALQGTHQDKIIKHDSSVYGNQDKWADGSLGSASEDITLLLPLDARYLARLRAINYSGESDYVYVDLTQAPGGTELFKKIINVFKVRYELDGGNWTGGPNDPNGMDDYTEYHAEDDAVPVSIQKPDGVNGTLEKGGNNWAAWRKSDGIRYPFTIGGDLEEYTDEKSLVLTALYGGGASGVFDYVIYDDKDYLIQEPWLKIETTVTPGVAGQFTVDPQLDFAKGTVGVKRTKGGSDYKVLVKLNLNTNPWNYDLVSLRVEGYGSTQFNTTQKAAVIGTDTTFEVDVSNWPTGLYQCLLIAQKGRTVVSKPITLTIADN